MILSVYEIKAFRKGGHLHRDLKDTVTTNISHKWSNKTKV